MSHSCLLAAVLTSTLSPLIAMEAAWHTIEVGGLVSSYSLEGPGVTGFEEEDEGARATGGGLYSRGHLGLARWAYLGMDVSAERVGSAVTVVRGQVTPGVQWQPGAGVALFAEAGVAVAWVDGLTGVSGRTPEAVGDGGADLGGVLAVGIRHQLTDRWQWHLRSGYQAYGQESYPATAGGGRSSGDGPTAEIGAALAITERWAAVASWSGIWVEDAGYRMDLDANQYRFGMRYTLP